MQLSSNGLGSGVGGNLVAVNLVAVDTVDLGSLGLALLEESLRVSTKVTSVSVSVETDTVTTADLLDVGLVCCERLDKLVLRDVVGEDTLAEGLGKDESLETVTSLLNGLVTLENELVSEQGVVDRETDLTGEAEELITVLVADVATHVCQGDGPGHVDGDGVTVTERREGSKLKGGGDGVTVGNDTVKTDLVKVRRLEVEHSLDGVAADGVGSLLELLGTRASGVTAVSGVDEVLAVLDEQAPGVLVSAVENLDELGGTVTGLADGEGLEEVEVKEGVHGSVVGTETVLQLLVVDTDLDGDGSVNQGNEGGTDTDVVGASAVRGTSVTENIRGETTTDNEDGLLADKTEVVHGIDKAEHGVHGLVELTALEDVESGLDVVVVEVCCCCEEQMGRVRVSALHSKEA